MRAVIDTNVLFEGLTRNAGACTVIVDAWLAELFTVCVSQALAYEYEDVLSRKLSPANWKELSVVLGTLLNQSQYVRLNFTWRPASNDPGDDKVIDCAMNANAAVVTYNRRDFRQAVRQLGLTVLSPQEFVSRLATELDSDQRK